MPVPFPTSVGIPRARVPPGTARDSGPGTGRTFGQTLQAWGLCCGHAVGLIVVLTVGETGLGWLLNRPREGQAGGDLS